MRAHDVSGVTLAEAGIRCCKHVIRMEMLMQRLWIASSTGLPSDGQPIEFLLDHRDVAIDGTYDHQTFRSRWTGYEVDRVKTWRASQNVATAVEVAL